MPLTDLPLTELRSHRPTVREPDDFDAFWAATVAEARAAAEHAGAVATTTPA
ncbi:acetylxylan esterase, partial [Curtobacterium sp. MCBA15_001]|uniref:acetylxylan esterase n=1 Tax=Curtobacterium sp. MCBA15_001 TaxID=1898731 RepID=UPI0011133AD5